MQIAMQTATKTALAKFLATDGIEGFELKAYDDATGKTLAEGDKPFGTPTIAGGLTRYKDGDLVKPGDELDVTEAWEEMFSYFDRELQPSIERLIQVPLDENQIVAVASLLFNLGETYLATPESEGKTVIRHINGRVDDETLARTWMRYHYARGNPLLGLYRRRAAEVLYWFGLEWRAALNITFENDIIDVMESLGWHYDDNSFDPASDMEELQYRSAKAAGHEGSLKEFLAHARGRPGDKPFSVNTKPPEQVPYGIEDPAKAGLKPMEESSRYQGAVAESKGKEMAGIGVGLAGAAGAASSAKEITGFFDAYDLSTILLAMLAVGAIFGGIGLWRWWHGRNKRYQAELDASQGLY
ncbi:MAG: lysozyme [Pseudomonadota bacterium]